MPGTNETRVVNEKTGGAKGSKDERYGLLPWDQFGEVARLYNFGAQKYEADNWRKGYNWSLSFDAMMRHAAAFWTGERKDGETGCDHMASVIFHAFALMYFSDFHPDLDDRPLQYLGIETPCAEPHVSMSGHISRSGTVHIDGVEIHGVSFVHASTCGGSIDKVQPVSDAADAMDLVMRDITPPGWPHTRELITTESDSPLENPIQAPTTLDERPAPLGSAASVSHGPVRVFTTDEGVGKPATATITVPVTMTIREFRDLLDGDNLPAHARHESV